MDAVTTAPARRATRTRLRIIPLLVMVGVGLSSRPVSAAIAPSKLGQFVLKNWSSDPVLLRSLRKAGLVKPDVADEKLLAVFKSVREEDKALPEVERRFNSPEERVRACLDPYLTDKGRKWAVPLDSQGDVMPSKLGAFVSKHWSSDAALLNSLREAGLVKAELTDAKLMAMLKTVREGHKALSDEERDFTPREEWVRVSLEPYLTDKGRKWAVPVESLHLPD